MIYILAAILIFGVLIAVHELGHFLAAKACGVRVNEFSIGMGPLIWHKETAETQYSLRLLPIGGFCAMEGEEEDSDDPAALNNQGFWRKLLIFAAGALMNFLTGLVIILVLYAGVKAVNVPVIHGFADDNVTIAHSLRLSQALMEAGRPHTFLPLTGITHMTNDPDVARNLLILQRDFLSDALAR